MGSGTLGVLCQNVWSIVLVDGLSPRIHSMSERLMVLGPQDAMICLAKAYSIPIVLEGGCR